MMQKGRYFLFFMFLYLGASAQVDFLAIENDLDIVLPEDYKSFAKENIGEEDFIYFFRIEDWYFWPLSEVKEITMDLRSKSILKSTEVAFASNEDNQTLFFKLTGKGIAQEQIFLRDEAENFVMFYAYSMSEIINFPIVEALIEQIETKGFKQQDLTPILDCPGSLFWYAFELNTSQFDDDFSLERNAKAIEIFKTIAAKEHPDAAHEMANYYYFAEETDIEKTIEWYQKSIAYGLEEDHYELADFILDYKLSAITDAIASLEYCIQNNIKREQALLKLSRLYMKGTGGHKDFKKGIQCTNLCVEAYDSFNAKSDLAFYYYKGMGVEKDVQKAYDLLKAANDQVKAKWGEGQWDAFLKQLEQELSK